MHPVIRINGELNPSTMLSVLDGIRTGDEVSTRKLLSNGTLRKLAQEFVRDAMLANLEPGDNKPGDSGYIADKTAFPCLLSLKHYPEQFEYIALLTRYFPDARKILLIRDVRDVIVSYSAWKGQRLGSLLGFSPFSFFRFVRHVRNWCLLHERWLADAGKDGNFLVIHYHEMKSGFTNVLEKVFDFLDIPVDDEFISMLERDFYSISGSVFAAENRRRGYGFFRSGRVGEWRDEFRWYHKLVTEIIFRKRIEKLCATHAAPGKGGQQ